MTTREKMAGLLSQALGAVFEPHRLVSNNNRFRHYADCCAWDGWGTLPAVGEQPPRKVHVYSWDAMGRCVKYGIGVSKHPEDHLDYEISANK